MPRHEGDAAGSFVLRLAVALQEHGARVHIVAPGAAGLPDRCTIEGVSIERVRYASDSRMTLAYTGTMAEAVAGSWAGRWDFLRLLWATRRRVRRCLDAARLVGEPYDVLHVHWWFPSGLALLKARRAGDPPTVITMHGSDVRLADKAPLSHPLMRAVLGEATVTTAVSAWLAALAERIMPTRRVRVAPMPVDMRHFTVPPDTAVRRGVLFVGRLNSQKGLADLLRAMALPALTDVPLLVVGDGPDRKALRMLASELGIGARITWCGPQPQHALAAHYASARALVMPSRGEGLGLVAVEAQLCGTPVVAYADGGLPDVVRPAHGGTLVRIGDIPGLAAAIAGIIASDDSVRDLGRAARADMLARFTPDAVARGYLEVYRDAIGACA